MPRTKKSHTTRFLKGARSAIDSTKEKIGESKEMAEETIKEHPLSSIAVAASIGIIIGFATGLLLRPRRKSWLDKLREYY